MYLSAGLQPAVDGALASHPGDTGALAQRQATELTHQVAQGKALPAEVVVQIVAKTDGVPLFVEELTKTVLGSGLLQEQEDHYVLTVPLPPLAIPVTLHDTLLARLDRLGRQRAWCNSGRRWGASFPMHCSRPLLRGTRRLYDRICSSWWWRSCYTSGGCRRRQRTSSRRPDPGRGDQSLLKRTRQQYHQHIAQVLEAQFPEIVETQPELLAHHYTEAGLAAQAVGYWQRAGERSHTRSTYVEAVAHLTQGLEVLQTLSDIPARAPRELDLQLTRGQVLAVTKGAGVPEVGHVIARARELCRQVGDASQLLRVLGGLGNSIGSVGRSRQDWSYRSSTSPWPSASTMRFASWRPTVVWGVHVYFLGEFAPSRTYLEQALALAGPWQDRARTFIAGEDIWVSCLGFVARVLWMLGYPDQALTRSHEMLTYAQELSHPYSRSRALLHAAMLHRLRREWLLPRSGSRPPWPSRPSKGWGSP